MAAPEKVSRTGVKREDGYLYSVRDGAVWRIRKVNLRKPDDQPEKVADGGIVQEEGYLYMLDKDGDIARAKKPEAGYGDD